MFRRPLALCCAAPALRGGAASALIALVLAYGATACSGDAEVKAKVTTGDKDGSTDDKDGSAAEDNGRAGAT